MSWAAMSLPEALASADRPSSFVADPFLWLGDEPSDPWHMFYETKTVTTMQVGAQLRITPVCAACLLPVNRPRKRTDGQCDYLSGHASLVPDMHSGGSERLHHHDLQQGHAANSSHAAHLSTMAHDRATSAWL